MSDPSPLQSETTEIPAPVPETGVNEHTYKFDVKMTCGGCSGAVTRALERAKTQGDGISSFNVSLDKQEVLVTGTIPYDDLLAKIKKTGKEVRSGQTID